MKPTAILTLLSLIACAHKEAPPELVGARSAYEKASSLPVTTQYDPAALHEAKIALDAAEQAYENEGPKDYTTLDLSYVAQRKAQLAIAKATIASEQAKQAAVTQQMAGMVEASQAQLASTQAEVAKTQAELAAEKAARDEADKRAADALKQLADVKRDQRGLVLTLSGSVLFKSNESTLLPEAQKRLTEVSQALMATKGQPLVIEGHTDSQGADDFNKDLSQRRAEAVKTYLVSQGYDSGLIQALGMGEATPVADNTTAEGRANNRRVEIVVKQPTEQQKPQ